MIKNIEIHDKRGNVVTPDPEKDDIILHVEKHTRSVTDLNINLLINLIHVKNDVFDPWIDGDNQLTPIFNLHATVKFGTKEYQSVLGDLTTVYFIDNHYFMVFFLMIVVFITMTVFCCLGSNYLKKRIDEEEGYQKMALLGDLKEKEDLTLNN